MNSVRLSRQKRLLTSDHLRRDLLFTVGRQLGRGSINCVDQTTRPLHRQRMYRAEHVSTGNYTIMGIFWPHRRSVFSHKMKLKPITQYIPLKVWLIRHKSTQNYTQNRNDGQLARFKLPHSNFPNRWRSVASLVRPKLRRVTGKRFFSVTIPMA